MTTNLMHKKALQADQAGFSLVEVLVSVVVLSIGVLGAVGMQVASMQGSKEVRNQAMAGSMGKELAEKMRANHRVAILNPNPYLLNTVITRTANFTLPSPNCATVTCTPAQLAAWDIEEWQMRMKDALPEPRVVICMDSAPFSGGVPRWNCDNNGDVAVLKLAWNRVDTKGDLTFTSGNGTTTVPLLVLPLTAGSSD